MEILNRKMNGRLSLPRARQQFRAIFGGTTYFLRFLPSRQKNANIENGIRSVRIAE
jgi:hypothetical protein